MKIKVRRTIRSLPDMRELHIEIVEWPFKTLRDREIYNVYHETETEWARENFGDYVIINLTPTGGPLINLLDKNFNRHSMRYNYNV